MAGNEIQNSTKVKLFKPPKHKQSVIDGLSLVLSKAH